MWLSHSGGRSWSCDQCKAKPALRRLRGNCGGQFLDGLPQSQVDEAGRFIPGYRVAPDSGASFSDLQIRSCPVADANRLASVVHAYSRHRAGLASLSVQFPQPSCAIVEAFDVLHSATEDMIARQREQAMKEAQNG